MKKRFEGNRLVYDVLNHGKENAISTQLLVRVFGCSVRELQKEIERERQMGFLICSSTRAGYWIGDTVEELAEFVNVNTSRVNSLNRMMESARQRIRELSGGDSHG